MIRVVGEKCVECLGRGLHVLPCVAGYRERIKVLEGQRKTWWRRAWYAHDVIARTDPDKAKELVADWEGFMPSESNSDGSNNRPDDA